MWRDAYLESRVLSADPMELILLLYENALGSVQSARQHLKSGNIAARSKAICQAIAVVAELNGSLDHASGGAISNNLENLYRYIEQRLTEGNMRQQDAPLAEAEGLLSTLFEAWQAVCPRTSADPASPASYQAAPAGAWRESGHTAEAWSA